MDEHHLPERDLFTDNLLVRIHVVLAMIWWTGLAPLEVELPFSGSLISTLLDHPPHHGIVCETANIQLTFRIVNNL